MADNPNVGPEPVDAKPNHDREKTYKAANTPKDLQDEKKKQPDGNAREKVSDEMDDATDEVKKRL